MQRKVDLGLNHKKKARIMSIKINDGPGAQQKNI
jgi:hypothetical protein